ncbi:CHAD domain-containing protein [Bradyrhizobium sp. LHD-71]|uniref:CHAD domain-containing protein n=1 Tax=Bradyrhizobium sp. LHD-71 TaxID=3072141 RepID=UPI00280CB447|nr:CHAD domain-containing protein [Bradyrhizobium sp. LHD-71]MDQ8727178.1 CHAD domain-containing protein [Bradyrhizobium sp. LHD-71]
MAYRFKSNTATVQDSVRDVAAELIDDAIETAKRRADPHVTVHNLRTACKKLRGLVRLIRPSFKDYRAENVAFRDAARGISSVRDGLVLIETYDSLLDAYDEQIDRARFAPIRRRLTTHRNQLAKHANTQARLDEFETAMREARDRVQDWTLARDGFEAIERGIARSYKDAKKAMADASSDATAEVVHEWRKRVKDHWYHTRLLTPIWPALMKAHRDVADSLGDVLGKHHDLDVFRNRLIEGKLGRATDIDVLTDLIRRRQKAFEDQAFLLGARLLAEPASGLTGRWHSYWDTWRSGEPQALAA